MERHGNPVEQKGRTCRITCVAVIGVEIAVSCLEFKTQGEKRVEKSSCCLQAEPLTCYSPRAPLTDDEPWFVDLFIGCFHNLLQMYIACMEECVPLQSCTKFCSCPAHEAGRTKSPTEVQEAGRNHQQNRSKQINLALMPHLVCPTHCSGIRGSRSREREPTQGRSKFLFGGTTPGGIGSRAIGKKARALWKVSARLDKSCGCHLHG